MNKGKLRWKLKIMPSLTHTLSGKKTTSKCQVHLGHAAFYVIKASHRDSLMFSSYHCIHIKKNIWIILRTFCDSFQQLLHFLNTLLYCTILFEWLIGCSFFASTLMMIGPEDVPHALCFRVVLLVWHLRNENGNFFKYGTNVHLDSIINWLDFGDQSSRSLWSIKQFS